MSRNKFALACLACLIASLALTAEARAQHEPAPAQPGTLEFYAEQTQLFILKWVPLACVVGVVALCISVCVLLSYIRGALTALARHLDGLATKLNTTLTSSFKDGALSQIPSAIHKIEGVLTALGKQVEPQDAKRAFEQLVAQLKDLSDAVRQSKPGTSG